MLTLLIDTSTERGIVAVAKDIEIIACTELPFGYHGSENLIPAIQALLNKLQCSLSELDLISVAVGPGSYTGIRIGAIVGKTLSYVAKKPLVGIPTLDSFIPHTSCNYISLIDAKISGVYCRDGTESKALPISELQKFEHIHTIVTPNKSRIQTLISNQCSNLKDCVWIERYPCPQQMAKTSLKKYQEGKFTMNQKLELLYLRKTQAEIEHDRLKN